MSTDQVVQEQKRWLAEKLWREVEEQGISQRELARRIGVSGPTLLAWMSKRSFPSPEAAIKLAAYFGWTCTPFWEFLEGDLRAVRKLLIDRLANILASIPSERREEAFRMLEAVAEQYRMQGGSSSE